MNKYTINDITRASGGFAMLAVDQREAMRMMFAAAGAPAPVADSVLTDFKVNAAKALSPYASAILVDQQFCYRQVVEQNAIAKSCAMIVAADEFIPGNGIPVDSVVIDRKINPLQIKQDGGKALKLLVLWRSDEDAQQRLDMVKEFNELCHSHGLVSIIEPVVRPPRRGDKFDREQAIIDAAKELGDSGADLYKVEMPLYGKGPQQELLCASQRLNDHINMPWVILSSGVDEKLFPRAVRVAMTAGASGFLAGRAVWASVVGLPDNELMLRDVCAPKLQQLGDILRRNVPVQNGHHTRLTGQGEGFFSAVVPAYICQHNIPLREINFLQPLCVRQQIRAGVVNDYPLAFGIHHDGGLRRFRLVIPFGVTGVNAPGFQLCQQAVARVVITYATNKIDLRPQPCRRNRCRRRWPATNFRIISRHVFTALRR